MKKLLFAVTALAALSLLAPSTGFAQGAYNQLGVYTDEHMADTTYPATPYENVSVYVVLSMPYDHGHEADISAIGGVEFRFVVDGGNMDLATAWANPQVTDVGNSANGHAAGFGNPSVVVDGHVLICTKSVLVTNVTGTYLYLTPIADGASIEGAMAFLNSDFLADPLTAMYPSSGATEEPVFGFNTGVTATDDASMDQIKAMYR
jgi:hypothetical protein